MKYVQQSSALLLYFLSSVVIILLNKLIVNRYMFKMHYFLVIVQSTVIVAIAAIYYAASRQRVSFRGARKWYVASALLTVMIFTNMKAVYYFPITLFTLFKNLSMILMAFLEFKYFNKKISLCGYLSLVLIVLSSYSANTTEPIQLQGYVWMAANILSTVGYIMFLRKIMVFDAASRVDSVFFTNLFGLPVLGVLSVSFDTPDFKFEDRTLWLLIAASSLCAFLTAYGTAWTLRVMSSTTLCMAGAVNKLMLSAGGFLIFQEKYSPLKVSSLAVGLLASVLYTYDSIKIVPAVVETVDDAVGLAT
ncbi:GDP-mannose transporter [Pancytospora philotis]|nr:GDP-mannose transporter [Pancytospora philotis]